MTRARRSPGGRASSGRHGPTNGCTSSALSGSSCAQRKRQRARQPAGQAMTAFFLARAVRGVLVAFGVLTVVFFVGRLTGDPVAHILGANATPSDIAEFRRLLGFDRPVYLQYFLYV